MRLVIKASTATYHYSPVPDSREGLAHQTRPAVFLNIPSQNSEIIAERFDNHAVVFMELPIY